MDVAVNRKNHLKIHLNSSQTQNVTVDLKIVRNFAPRLESTQTLSQIPADGKTRYG